VHAQCLRAPLDIGGTDSAKHSSLHK